MSAQRNVVVLALAMVAASVPIGLLDTGSAMPGAGPDALSTSSSYAKVTESTADTCHLFGSDVDIDDDGERVIYGAPLSGISWTGRPAKRIHGEPQPLLQEARLTALADGGDPYDGSWGIVQHPASMCRDDASFFYDQAQSFGAAYVGGALAPGEGLVPDAYGEDRIFSFGRSVAIDGDTAVVQGALADGNPIEGAASWGTVWVFERTESGWSQQSRIESPHLSTAFGWAGIDISGDTLVVSDYLPTSDGPLGTAALVYERDAEGAWDLVATLAPPGAHSVGRGFGLSLDGDTIALGADLATTPGANDTGAVYVFRRSGETWAQDEVLRPVSHDDGETHSLGFSVDVDGGTIVAGAPGSCAGPGPDRCSLTASGQVHVFSREAGGWTRDALLVHQPEHWGRLGFSVSVHGDQLVAGQPTHHKAGDAVGEAFRFIRQDGSWALDADLVPSATDYHAYPVSYGWAVAHANGTSVVGQPTSDGWNPSSQTEGSEAMFSGDVYTYRANSLPTGPQRPPLPSCILGVVCL